VPRFGRTMRNGYQCRLSFCLQNMNGRRVEAFRLETYFSHAMCARVCHLFLMLTLLALPLAGIGGERAPILAPLSAELVLLGTNLQVPPSALPEASSFVDRFRPLLGPLPSAVRATVNDNSGDSINVWHPGFPDSGIGDDHNGRSPPSS
jgi:hypothetical protein